MSTLTLPDLMAADSRPFHRAAMAWAAMAEDIDNAYEQIVRGIKLVDDGAHGSAALAAVRALTAQSHRISNSFNPARRIADALDHHASTMDDLHRLLVGVQGTAVANGLILNWTTGQVVAPPTVMHTDDQAYWTKPIAQVREDLQSILSRARRLDDETVAALRGALPSPVGDGFGAGLSYHIERATVASFVNDSPYDVHRWWLSLSPDQQERVLRDYPDIVGGFDGVPATDRDRANRVNLQSQLADLRAQEADLQRRIAELGGPGSQGVGFAGLNPALAQVQREIAGLQLVQGKLDQLGAPALLVGIDHAGDGKAIVALGDPDTARHVAVFVPGVATDLQDIGGDMDRVRNLRDAADIKTVAPNDVSVTYWLGYDTPGNDPSALSDTFAKEGGTVFVPFVDGIQSTHQPDAGPPHVTAIGHSYGSTTIAEAAFSGQLKVDDIVAAGSPGMDTYRASSLNIDPRHVWGGAASDDPVVGASNVFGEHDGLPTNPDFGDNRYVVDTSGHSAYWTPNSTSLTNQASIVVGQYGQVSLEYGTAPSNLA